MIDITKECEICGAMFTPINSYRRVCPECHDVLHRNKGRNLPRRYEGIVYVDKYERELSERNYANYHDTIVAIGYAERQIARSLELAGKVKTEL